MIGRIVFVFFIIVLLGIVLYFYNAGVTNRGPSFWRLLTLPSSTPPAIGPAYRPPSSVVPPSGPGANQSPSAPLPTPPEGFTVNQLSPFYHQVRFGGISPGSPFYFGQITLYAYPPSATATIDITGWQIKSNRGGEYIPQAIMFYDPLGLTPATDIRIKSGDFVNLYSSSAPINLRLNKCIGYLPNRTQFNPPLPQNCPYIDRSRFGEFSGACQNYITSLGGCQLPNLSSPSLPQNDYNCRDYVANHFNYRSCVEEHQNDSDFLASEIRVWMGASPVDQFHDRVLLLDRSGLLVDLTSY